MLSKIKDNLPLVTVFLLIICLIRLVVFYQVFGIAIADYIELSEILSLLSDYLLAIFTFFLMYLLLILVVDELIPASVQESVEKKLVIDAKKLSSKVLLIITTLGYVAGTIYIFYIGQGSYILTTLGFALSAGFVYLAAKQLKKKLQKEELTPKEIDLNNQNNRLINGASFLLVFVFLNVYISFMMGYELREKSTVEERTRVTIEYEDKLIRTSPNYLYVGRVKNFTFFYNKQTDAAHAYPNSGIKRIYMRKINRDKSVFPW